jgi:hypothetical protein
MVVADCLEQMRLLQPGKPSESITLKSRVCRGLPTAYPTHDLGPTTKEDISDWSMQEGTQTKIYGTTSSSGLLGGWACNTLRAGNLPHIL